MAFRHINNYKGSWGGAWHSGTLIIIRGLGRCMAFRHINNYKGSWGGARHSGTSESDQPRGKDAPEHGDSIFSGQY